LLKGRPYATQNAENLDRDCRGGGLCLLAREVVVAGIALTPKIYTAMLTRSSLQVNTEAPDFELGTFSG
jgi:hypothetical protein